MRARWLAILAILALLVLFWALSGREGAPHTPPAPTPEPPAGSDPAPGVRPDPALPSSPEAGSPDEKQESDAAPAKPTTTIELTVKVTRPGGEPASGATVMILEHFVYQEYPWDPLGAAPNERARIATGEDGTARLVFCGEHLHGVQVIVFTDNHAARGKTLYLKPGSATISLELAPSPPIRIEVVDREGLRVRDAHLRLIAPDTSTTMLSSYGPYGFEMAPISSGDGFFEFAPVAMERDPIADGGGFLVFANAPGFLPLDRWFPASEVGSGEIKLRLVRRVTVRGRFVDAIGRPVVSVRIGSERTGEDGTFEVKDFAETGGALLVFPPSHVPFVARVPPADGPVADLGDLTLQEGATIRGEVVDDDGRPVANARVAAWHRDLGPAAARITRTRRGGDFTVPNLKEGPHVVLVTDSWAPPPGPGPGGGGWAKRKARFEGVPAGTSDMRIRLSGGLLLRIDFVLENGSPAKLIYVHVVARHLEADHEELGWWPSYEPLVRFRMKRPGKYRITVACSGYETSTHSVEVFADREARIKVVMKKAP